MILCDLPYGTTQCKWDSVIPFELLWIHYKRIIKPGSAIVLTGSQPFTTVAIGSNMDWFKYCWVWEKSRPGDVFNARNKPLKSHEDIMVFSDGTTANGSNRKMKYFPQGVGEGGKASYNKIKDGAAFRGQRPSHKETHITHGSGYPRSVIKVSNVNTKSLHPTQKPVALMEYLIKTYTNEGEIVLDNCMGSGTTGIACINTDRRFIGIEKDDKYFDIAKDRIDNHVKV